jgi:hypothetical protein
VKVVGVLVRNQDRVRPQVGGAHIVRRVRRPRAEKRGTLQPGIREQCEAVVRDLEARVRVQVHGQPLA